MKVIVCGGRAYRDRERVHAELDALHTVTPIDVIMTGGCSGADQLAEAWGYLRGVNRMVFAAYWETEGLAAGPKRNNRMLSLGPDLVLAFPGGSGTADMVRRAESKGVRVRKVR